MKRLQLSLISTLLIFSTSAYTIELNQVLDEALITNPQVKERLNNYEKTVYDLKIAKSEYQPTLDYVGKFGYEKTLDQVGSGRQDVGYHTYRNSLILTQNLFSGLSTKYRVKFEEARVMAAAYNYVEQTNDIAFNIVRHYINVLKFNELFTLEKENVLLTQDILSKTKQLSDAGSGLISDVKKVDSSLQLAEFNLLTQENNLQDAQFNLSKLTGKKLKQEELEYPNFNYPLPKTQEDALNHAIQFNPSILVTNYNIETAKAQLVQNRSKFSPKVDFELAYNFDRNTGGDVGHERNYSALLVVRHNFYNGQADINSVRKSKMTIKQEYEIQRDIKRQIIENLNLSWSAYSMLERQILFLQSYQEQSKLTLDLYKEEFEAGTRTLIDLLSAQDDYISARNKLITANYDYLFAKFRVLDAMGELINTVFKDQAAKYYEPAIAKHQNTQDYELQDRSDLDKDSVIDSRDLCDNTTLGLKVDMFGCAVESKEEIVQPVPTNLTTTKNNFQSANSGYTLNLATFSSKKIVDKFLDESKIDKNQVYIIKYTTKASQKELYKIVYGIFNTKEKAYENLNNMPRIVKVNKPYLDEIVNVKNEYLN